MNFLVSVLWGALWAIALKKREEIISLSSSPTGGPSSTQMPLHHPLGWWRMGAGAVAGAVPHIEEAFHLLGEAGQVYEKYVFGPTWSLIFSPLYAFLLAGAFHKISGKPLKQFFILCWVALLANIALASFTAEGIRIFWPLTEQRTALNSLFPFDLFYLGLSITALSLVIIMRKWQQDIARFAIACLLVYTGVVLTFNLKATDFAQQYAEAFRLNVESLDALPQPMSPFNWQLMVQTTDDRLHETSVNLFRTEEIKVQPDFSRAQRINARFKPIHKAIWRVYHRVSLLNDAQLPQAEQIWTTLQNNPLLYWKLRYAVFSDFTKLGALDCVHFKDIRYETARHAERGKITVCKTPDGYRLF